MKLSNYVAQFLSKQTDHIFVGNGGVVVHLLDSLGKQEGIQVVPCENEQAASIAAEAYSRVKPGQIGICLAASNISTKLDS